MANSNGPMNILTGIGVLGLSFCFVVFSGLQPTQIAQPVSKIQMDLVVQTAQQAVQLGQKEESQRACILSKTDPDYLSTMEASEKLLGIGEGGT